MSAPSDLKKVSTLELLKSMFCAGLGACTAQLLTIPFSTLKVRLHLQGSHNFTSMQFNGAFDLASKIYRNEGMLAFWDGLLPGLQSHCIYAPLSVGLFQNVREKVKNAICGDKPATFFVRLLSGFICTTIAITASNPMDVLKVRMQTRGSNSKSKYKGQSALNVLRMVVKHEGVGGLWKGASPNILRNLVMGTTQLSTNDQVKYLLKEKRGWAYDWRLVAVSAFCAGTAQVSVGQPIDIIRSRKLVHGAKFTLRELASGVYSQGGIRAFYRGYWMGLLRLTSFNIVLFSAVHQYKRLL